MRRVIRRGWTLIEAAIAVAVLSLVMAVTLQITTQTGEVVGEGLERSATAMRANRCGRLLAGEMRNASRESVQLGNAAQSTGSFTRVSFRPATAFDTDAGETVLGPRVEVRFVLDPGESWAGTPVDDDGDGLVDEGSLVLFRDRNGDDVLSAGERVCTLAQGVAGSTLAFRLPSGGQTASGNDAQVDVSFEIHHRLANGGTTVARRDVRVALRN